MPTATRTCSGLFVVVVVELGASSLQSPTRPTPLLLSLALFLRSRPPTPTQLISCSRRSFGSPRPSSSKATGAIVVYQSRVSSSVSYHPKGLQSRLLPHSSLFSNLHIPYQVSLFIIQPPCSKTGWSPLWPYFLPFPMSDSRPRSHLGYSPRMSWLPINPKSSLENSSRHVDPCTTCE